MAVCRQLLIEHFYPRPPRGGRRVQLNAAKEDVVFLSTPSARRATAFSYIRAVRETISIHALREEGDQPALANGG